VGASPAGAEIVFALRLSKRSGAHAPRLVICRADQWDTPLLISPMTLLRDEPTQTWYTARFTPQQPGLLFYRFDAEAGDLRRPILRTGGLFEGYLGAYGGEHWQLTVFDKHMRPPKALSGGILYQIFPDRFFNSGREKANIPSDRLLRADWGALPVWRPDSGGKVLCNDYFGGDLEGIRQKLPYLASLGVTAVYLNPVFEAHSNHRYNTADYTKIDPLLGDAKDLERLCDEAGKQGIAVLLDGVFSHTGADSLYFNREGRYGAGGAFRDPASPYAKWYRFERYPDVYKSWWGIDTLPEVDENQPSYLSYIAGEGGVIDRWMKAGVAGWRLDVADELPDGALDAICAAIRRFDPDAAIIGEVWEDASNKVSYGVRRRYLTGGQLSSVTNYPTPFWDLCARAAPSAFSRRF
jgi:cyclomaltodextrinase